MHKNNTQNSEIEVLISSSANKGQIRPPCHHCPQPMEMYTEFDATSPFL